MPRTPSRHGIRPRQELGTPLTSHATRLLLLGSGELGREVALEAMRLGAEVIAVDRYADAPAMQVAHRSHVVPMTDAAALRTLVETEAPDLIVPEIEQIDTPTLQALEQEGWNVIPNASATRATMDREILRKRAAISARVPTSRYAFVDSAAEAQRAVQELGLPCIFKAMTSSSGHGASVVRSSPEVEAAYVRARDDGRVRNPRVMIEEFIPFDLEITQLTLRHFDAHGRVVTSFLEPIAHVRPGAHYVESWQPCGLPTSVVQRAQGIAQAVTDELGGLGIFGVEEFVRGEQVYFSEVSPRPHDTGLVTLVTQRESEFALHARAVLGLPVTSLEPPLPGAAHVILAERDGWAPVLGGLAEAWAIPGVRVHLFGKPNAYPDRRMGIALARGTDVAEARERARRAADAVTRAVRYPAG